MPELLLTPNFYLRRLHLILQIPGVAIASLILPQAIELRALQALEFQVKEKWKGNSRAFFFVFFVMFLGFLRLKPFLLMLFLHDKHPSVLQTYPLEKGERFTNQVFPS
jgi:hypothetical protein